MIFKAINKFFAFNDGEVDLSRRKFIRDAATLSALAVTATTTPQLAQKLIATIKEQINGGRITDQTFFLDEPIVIDIPNVVFERCRFIAQRPMPYMLKLGPNAKNTILQSCHLDLRKMGAGVEISVSPQEGDMTKIFQSVIDTAQTAESPSILLAQGRYEVQSPTIWASGIRLRGGV